MLRRIALTCGLASAVPAAAPGQTTLTWSNPGSGGWTTGTNWRDESDQPVGWTNGATAVFASPNPATAPQTVTLSTTPRAAAVRFDTDGYTLALSSSTATLNAPVELADGVDLTLFGRASGSLSINLTGAITAAPGAAARLVIAGNQSPLQSSALVLQSGVAAGVAVDIDQAGTGPTGLVAVAAGVAVGGPVRNSSSGPTLLGARPNATLTVSGAVTGSQGVRIAAGPPMAAGNGSGTVVLASRLNAYLGPTVVANAFGSGGPAGVLRLGDDDVLPDATAVRFGLAGRSDAGAVDLNGRSDTVAAIAVDGSQARGFTNTAATTATLRIGGGQATSFSAGIGALPAAVVADANDAIAVELTAAHTGSLTLSKPDGNTYAGGTVVNGGTLLVSNTSGSATGSGSLAVGVGGAVGGTGVIAPAAGNTVAIAGLVSPGDAADPSGTLTFGADVALTGRYAVDLSDVAGGGGDVDLLAVGGALDLAGATVDVTAATGHGFDDTASYTWRVATASGGITGRPAVGTVGGFGPFAGRFALAVVGVGGGAELRLSYTPVPEPAAGLAAAVGLWAAWAGVRARRPSPARRCRC